jgi:spermidine synthase
MEVILINGKKILDTEKSNYSYGSLQRILHSGLTAINFDKDSADRILVLGLGGGSIIETIRKDFKSDAFIELVEIDAEMISIAVDEFKVNEFANIHITHADALKYLRKNKNPFDLIIVDIFIIDTVPEIFTQEKFLENLSKHLNENGKIIYNTMAETMPEKVFDSIKKSLSRKNFKVRVVEKVEQTNNLIIAEKPANSL